MNLFGMALSGWLKCRVGIVDESLEMESRKGICFHENITTDNAI